MGAQAKKTVVSVARNYREAPLRPASLDVEGRTVEVVWATTTPVLRMWPDGELYWEVLSLDPAHIVLDRFTKGLSVLDAHDRFTTKSIYGVATDPTFPPGHTESTCKARFSKNNPEADRVFKDIEDQIIRHWSFGYDVLRMERTDQVIDAAPVYLATQWEPFELSVVPVPADPNAGVRSKEAQSRSCEIIHFRGNTMTDEEKKRQEEEEKKRNEEEEKARKKKEEEEAAEKAKKAKEKAEEEERAKLAAAGSGSTKQQERAGERRRISEIRAAFEAMPHVIAKAEMERYIDQELPADDFRKAILDAAREKQPAISSMPDISVGREATEKRRELMSTAILSRANPRQYSLSDPQYADARQFRGMTLIDMARESLRTASVDCTGMTHREIAETALGMRQARGMHATGDFPILLADTINKSLRQAYKLAAPTFKQYCRQASFRDFKERHLVQISDVGKFQKVLEGGEYKFTSFGEAKESYRLFKYGNRVYLSWESIINDDLDAFNRIPTSIAIEANQHEADIVYDILLKNPKMGDGKQLFDAGHNNVGAAADIDLDGMDAAFTAIGTQKNSNGRIMNLSPEYLIIGHNMRTKALQYLNDTVVPTKAEDVTPSQMRGLTPIVEGRITGKQWFLACSPDLIDTIEYAYLEGEEGLFTEERWGFEVDGLEIKARLVFGAKAIDWRGLYRNPGQ